MDATARHLPLLAQPGEDWLYTTGSNLQGVLVASASGQPLSAFLRRTHLRAARDEGHRRSSCRPAKIDRLAHAYRSQDGKLVVSDEPATGKWSRPPRVRAGRCRARYRPSTTISRSRDVACRRPASGTGAARARLGQGDEDRSSDGAAARRRRDILGRGRGWGYGMSVVTSTPSPGQPAPGSFGWIGGFGTIVDQRPGERPDGDPADPTRVRKRDAGAALRRV